MKIESFFYWRQGAKFCLQLPGWRALLLLKSVVLILAHDARNSKAAAAVRCGLPGAGRRFRTDAVDPKLLEELLALSACAPSVGLSQPWRFVLVESAKRRLAIR